MKTIQYFHYSEKNYYERFVKPFLSHIRGVESHQLDASETLVRIYNEQRVCVAIDTLNDAICKFNPDFFPSGTYNIEYIEDSRLISKSFRVI